MKIYTRKGDDGGTGLFGGGRVSKADARVATYGDIDELNSLLGVCRAHGLPPDIDVLLSRVQNELFHFGAELATSPEHQKDIGIPKLGDADVEALEQAIDRADEELAPLTTFVLPGGTTPAAHLNVARTVCRRAERALVALAATEPVRPELLRYANRLSDLLFTLARLANHRAGVADVPWIGRKA
jgi:cob(I)alamin adenosyltransferase